MFTFQLVSGMQTQSIFKRKQTYIGIFLDKFRLAIVDR